MPRDPHHPVPDTLTLGEHTPWSLDGDPATGPAFGRYRLREPIGSGGTGVVYCAWDPELEREVAIKVLRDGTKASELARERLHREARAVGRLNHPGIVAVYDVGEQEGRTYLTMELLPTSLADRRPSGPIPPDAAVDLIGRVADALAFAHAHALVHRDVKPGNILLDRKGHPKLTDFGLVKHLSASADPLTAQGEMVGTIGYLAPEQARGEEVGPAADQFSLGAILFELLQGAPPFGRGGTADVLYRVLETAPPPMVDVPLGLQRVCRRALEKAPADRFADMTEFAAALRGWRDVQVPAGRRPWPGPLTWWLGAALVASVGMGAWSYRTTERGPDATARVHAMTSRLVDLRLRGEEARAVAALDGFLQLEEGTRAAPQMLLAEASGRLRAGKNGTAEAARAFILAEHPEDRRDAVLALGDALAQAQDWPALYRWRAGVASLSPAAAASAEGRRLLGLASASHGELRGLTGPLRDVGRALAGATETEHHAKTAVAWDTNGDGRDELVLLEGDALVILSPGDLQRPVRLDSPGVWSLSPLHPGPDGRARAAACDAKGCFEARIGPTALERVRGLPLPPGYVAAHGDVDGDGVPELYVGNHRLVHRLMADDEPTLFAPHPGTNASNSDVNGLVVADLDGDGSSELAAALGTWGAYDLRVFVPEGPHSVRLDARLMLGNVRHLVAVRTPDGPRLVTQLRSPWAALDASAFGPDLPHGEPSGLYVVAWSPGQLRAERVLAPPLPAHWVVPVSSQAGESLLAADLNGDGFDEVVHTSRKGWMHLYDPTAGLGPVPVAGLAPLVALQLDEDPAEELVVRDLLDGDRVWALGVGSMAPPLRPIADVPPGAGPPSQVSDAVASRWRRSEVLLSLVPEVAAREFSSLANVIADPTASAAASARAAEVWGTVGDLGRAADAWRQVTRAPGLAEKGWTALQQTLVADRRFPEALQAARARVALGIEVSDLASLETLAAPSRVPVALQDHLDERIRLEDALEVRWGRGLGGLWAHTGDTRRLWSVPLRTTGGRIGIEVELTPGTMAWGERHHLLLTTDEEAVDGPALYWQFGGGGGVHVGSAGCPVAPTGAGGGITDIEGRFTLRWTWVPAEKKGVCVLVEDGLERNRVVFSGDLDIDLSDPDLQLVMASRSTAGAVSTSTLHAVTLIGMEPAPWTPTPAEHALRALVVGEPEGIWREDLPDSLRWLSELGTGSSSVASVQLVRQLERAGDLLPLMRVRPEAGWLLRPALGDARFLRAFREAHQLGISSHSTSDWMTDVLQDQALDLTAVESDPFDRAWLLRARGASHLRLGRIDHARADLSEAMNLAEQADPEDRRWTRLLRGLLVELAILRVERAAPESALELLERALALSPTPEIVADRLVQRVELKPLHTLPGWAAIEDARRLTRT